ncbi:hypothetical protein DFH08DRAFT_823228 [Mycena albidolilacea]|uniref:Uncharacterized protein n=1 Tax=Mycena albidolilacea TaxID=1033008 RepID=A0AAD6Z6K1_9AGAR|nr:hypothetical protein DFH08DRAFT_823228 [Mycena albidolilacea]
MRTQWAQSTSNEEEIGQRQLLCWRYIATWAHQDKMAGQREIVQEREGEKGRKDGLIDPARITYVSDRFPAKSLAGWPPSRGPKKTAVKPGLKPKPSQALPAGLGSSLTDFKPKPAQAKPKPWFQSQAKPEHH